MVRTLGIPLSLLALGGAFIAMTWVMTFRLTPDFRRKLMLRWLGAWSGKGLLLPIVFWALMNFGISWRLEPFMPQIQFAQNNGKSWLPVWWQVTSAGLFIASSYWTALTLIWVLYSTSQVVDDESKKDFRGLAVTCCLGLGIPALFVALLGGWPMFGFAASIIIAPIAGYAPGILKPKQMPPMYAKAVARIKFGKYSEAEFEILRELEKCEDDFEGWLMLAELYATQYKDIPEAERTILEICDQPKITPTQLSISLHRLADWHLKIAEDPDAARRALEMIMYRLRGSHLARMAQLRINQLPPTREALQDQLAHKTIPLPALGGPLDFDAETPKPTLEKKEAARQANGCVDLLKLDPNDTVVRERLARLFAEQLQQPELGIEQLQLLLNMPNQPDQKRAAWLALVASWHLRYRHDQPTGLRFLERLIDEFPESPEAFSARNRLERLKRSAVSPRPSNVI